MTDPATKPVASTRQNVFWATIQKGTAALLSVVSIALLTRILGPSVFGQFAIIISLLAVVGMIARFGIDRSLQRFLAEHVEKDPGEIPHIITEGMKIKLVITSGTLLLVGLIAPLLARWFHLDSPLLVYWLLPLVFTTQFTDLARSAFEALRTVRHSAVVSALEHGGRLLLGVGAALTGWGVIGVVAMFSTAAGIAAIVGLVLLFRQVRVPAKRASSMRYRGKILRYSVPFVFTSFSRFLTVEVDILMLGIISPGAGVGIYAAAKHISQYLPVVLSPLIIAVGPKFAHLTRATIAARKALFLSTLRILALFGSVLFVVLFFFAGPIITVLYGDAYTESSAILQILSIYFVGFLLSSLTNAFLDYTGHGYRRVGILLGTALLNIALNALLIPQYGPHGAAVATVISFTVHVFLSYLFTYRIIRGVEAQSPDDPSQSSAIIRK